MGKCYSLLATLRLQDAPRSVVEIGELLGKPSELLGRSLIIAIKLGLSSAHIQMDGVHLLLLGRR